MVNVRLPHSSDLPELDIDATGLEEAADWLSRSARDFNDRAGDMDSHWSGLSGVFTVNGTDRIYSAFTPGVEVAEDYSQAMRSAASALGTFAIAVALLKAQRDELDNEISALRMIAVAVEAQDPDYPSFYSDASVETMAWDLKGRVADLSDRFGYAEDACILALGTITGGTGHGLPSPGSLGQLGIVPATGMPIWHSQTDLFASSTSDRALNSLTYLGTLTSAQVTRWLASHPEFLEAMDDMPPDAGEVAAWWHALGSSAESASDGQLALIAAVPSLVGSLEGVAYWGRDKANRLRLTEAIEIERKRLAMYNPRLEALENIVDALGPNEQIPPRLLASLELGDRPLAAITVGDLDRAAHVNYQVSGMFSGTDKMTDAVADAAALYQAEMIWADALGIDGEIATVAWIGYDSPDLLSVRHAESATLGAAKLEQALGGFGAVTDARGTDPFLSVHAHSYGTTTALIALQQPLGVDALAMYGSAGSEGVRSVEQLEVDREQVYVSTTSPDGLAAFGRLISGRGDPDSDRFGAVDFGSDGDSIDPVTGQAFVPISGHTEYLTEGSESLRNLVLIGLGRGDLVTKG
ncbi:hypothetical protein E3O25_12065 [Cryobacterium sp. TMT1-3]|uniref:alpha/beta hydrolase n=1 Tax=Cryobacterium sp. TMT1-3 TaxID=1259237 RepID=UPI00106CC559|nr:alpha/beta hydrolase [Cryobacterium sp. TMT1-3]TFC26103.1 hypothetical protein E3O25_12065 [Cryobacterium sp. TMT1-3]